MNERLKILKLLEDGKINAEETARLLEALLQPAGKERKKRFKVWSSMETIPEVIASAIAGSFKCSASKETFQFPKKKKIEFKCISGDLEIIGGTTETVEVVKDGLAKINDKGNTLEIKAISGDLKITTPITTDVSIEGVSGDLNISNLNGKIEIASVSGDIRGKELSNSFIGEVVFGDVELDYQKVEEIKIKSRRGDINLSLDKNVEAEIVLETENGHIDCQFELKNEERTEHRIRGVINNPKAKIEIRNEHGDISIMKRK